MGHATVERFGCWILGQVQDLATVDAGQATSPGDQQEAQVRMLRKAKA
jgi:hypothetical protein